MRWRRALTQVVILCGVCSFILILFDPRRRTRHDDDSLAEEYLEFTKHAFNDTNEPGLIPLPTVHPIEQLIEHGKQEFFSVRARQSNSLKEAVKEYRKRYGIPPPPRFDKWYDFAKKRGVQLIDEFDTIHESLQPFWALEPATIRERVREALGRGQNGLIAMLIRGGRPVLIEGGPEWQRNVTLGMIKEFVHLLPDMDVAFNIHDEPRVVVPHDELSLMIQEAHDVAMPKALGNKRPRNTFSRRPEDMDDGKRLKEYRSTRFNEFAHQHTWGQSRLSCDPESPARDYRDDVPDNVTSYAFGAMGFVYNETAFSDVCFSPSLRESHGFFDRPNAFKISHELIPIFSQSKMSCYQDILYPSPWYWYGKTVTDQPPEMHQPQYNETLDMNWDEKDGTLWWRGTTTGGYSRDGGWRHQHRQQFLRKANALNKGKMLVNKGTETLPNWRITQEERNNSRHLVDLKFTGVGQCDAEDCNAQREFFEIAPPVNSQDAWKSRYLLDIDGNAFSGRFYAFLRSKSMVFKMAVFREWHREWLWPWVHYIPVTLQGDDYLEAVRYLEEEDEGRVQGPKMATQSREWANKALRNVDLETWLFRLLLEYGRVIDDARTSIGFDI